MMNNTKLNINRVVIKKSGHTAYDQIFHKGINVIRGENSTGKSTILELISYGLGADIKRSHWKREALSCDEIFIDLSLNNKRFVFKRAIEGDGNKPAIYMIEKDYESAIKELEGWAKYGYRKTDNKVSFATRIFDLLGFNQHVTSDNDNLTVHQIFRLLYADQDTPASNIFRWESLNYDKDSMRVAIGEFLFGFDDLTIHSLRQKLILAEKNFEKIHEELIAVYKVLGKTNIKATSKELYEELTALDLSLSETELKISELKRDSINSYSKELTELAKKLNSNISSLSGKIASLKEEVISISYSIEENQEFLENLDYRKNAILNSQATVNILGMVEFQYCPSCLQKVKLNEAHNKCSLCKAEKSSEIVNNSYLQAIEQIDFQRKETKELIDISLEQRAVLTASINSKIDDLDKLKRQFKEINTYSDDYEIELKSLFIEKGYIESQKNNIKDKLELAAEIDFKIQQKVELQDSITRYKDELSRSEFAQKKRMKKVLSEISNLVVKILKLDTGTEKSFINPKKFEFDFGQNIMLLDERANFSASSNVLLKNAFHLATLFVACNDNQFRIPCFGMFDNIEDKGMTEDRSQNFQRIILKIFSELKTDFQIIMTTSMVDKSLDNDIFGVGPFYNAGEHTLQI